MKSFLVFCIVSFVGVLGYHRIQESHAEGFRLGMHYALKTNPTSEELEMVCAGLWIGDQNKKMWKKQNASQY